MKKTIGIINVLAIIMFTASMVWAAETQTVNDAKNLAVAEIEKIDINKATENELTALPQIGPAKAKAIVAYRDTNGPFATIEAIKNVKGIGDKIFQIIEPQIELGKLPADGKKKS